MANIPPLSNAYTKYNVERSFIRNFFFVLERASRFLAQEPMFVLNRLAGCFYALAWAQKNGFRGGSRFLKVVARTGIEPVTQGFSVLWTLFIFSGFAGGGVQKVCKLGLF